MNIFTNNKDFYPTPNHIAEQMAEKVDWHQIRYVLEPSAGKGDILDYIKNRRIENRYYRYSSELKIDCIEVQEELQAILKNKEANVVFNDFLQFTTHKRYDLIIMNPPFSEGDKHLLKAIDLVREGGGQIVCLLNEETLKNPYTSTRKDLSVRLEKYNANIEYLSSAFIGSERETNVNIAIVYLNIEGESNGSSFIYENLKKAHKIKEDIFKNPDEIIERDFIKNIVDQYNMEIEMGLTFIKEYKSIAPYIMGDFKKSSTRPVLNLTIGDKDSLDINRYIELIRLKYWTALFDRKEISSALTNKSRNDYMADIDNMRNFDFNAHNIMQLRINLSENLIKSVEESILHFFDRITNEHSWYNKGSRTIHYYNGWKTNKCYKVGNKAILPVNAWDEICKCFRYNYTVTGEINEIHKIFSFLDAKTPSMLSDISKILENAAKIGQTQNIELKYFYLTFYKKGTCHITFKDEELLKALNIFGGQRKNWLPPSYAKKTYQEMDDEERAVIDSFEGKISYEDVCENKDKYFIDSFSLPALSAI